MIEIFRVSNESDVCPPTAFEWKMIEISIVEVRGEVTALKDTDSEAHCK